MLHLLAASLLTLAGLQGPPPALSHGPFLGHTDIDRGTVWARASAPGEFRLSVADAKGASKSLAATASEVNDLCLRWDVTGLEPDSAYTCTIGAGETAEGIGESFTLRTPPAHDAPRVTRIAFGSCSHEGRFPIQPIWKRIELVQAEVMVLLGDTPYIDSTDLEVQRRRYREFYGALPEMQALLRGTPFYATWDDHDFGRNDTTGNLPGKENSRRAFVAYHANPTHGQGGEGIFTSFRRGAIEIFLLDTRWFAGTEDSPFDEGRKGLLGASQWEWLERELAASSATFKVLASGMIWNGATRPGKRDHWGTYPRERQAIFEMIGRLSIPGVVLVGGDIHRTRALRYPTTESAGYELYEFITSPMANTVIAAANAPSEHLLHDAGVQQTFLLLTADTTARPATLTARFLDQEGDELFAVATDAGALRPR
ncbi:MAG: alkaline phosphatase D family protein [Planctomycetota bacterium]|jgi:alkaline phosphatase D|nr:alkaline phosphatase D family protein [Planctomycetota bacterium]MDP6762239.1 alkaline phosphatase D family protein [Planctomycetota bacterium]MDP6989340.1 alkaline phosphatase D family protein [Planctomycetota bacterium]